MFNQKSFENDLPTLFLVSTPIGNLEEITLRAIEILKTVDIIACEDTRTTMKLLDHYDIKAQLISHHSHNEEESVNGILKLLASGKNIALVSDAGTPLISDPGNLLVNMVIMEGYNVVPVSGASAVLSALITSGLQAHPYVFHGFLPSTKKQLRRTLNEYKYFSYTMVFYVSVHKLSMTLEEMLVTFGDRKVSLAREMTKKHEHFLRGQLSKVIKEIDDLKGEFVLVVEGNPHEKEADIQEMDVQFMIDDLVEKGYSASSAIKEIASKHNLNRNKLYQDYLLRKAT